MRNLIDYEHRYRQLVERLPAIVYRSSVLAGDWHYVSPAIERVLGWTAEEWLAHPAPWGTTIHPDDHAAALLQEERAVESGSLVSEYRLYHRNGSEVWIRDEAVLLEEDGEPQWHGFLTDVTEERTLESGCGSPRSWRRSVSSRAASPTTSTICSSAISGYGSSLWNGRRRWRAAPTTSSRSLRRREGLAT